MRFLLNRLPFTWRATLQAIHGRRVAQRAEEAMGLIELNRRYWTSAGLVVRRGPFQNMHYTRRVSKRHILPRLLGRYEEELHPWIEQIIARRPTSVIDVGCAEGYYAIGMARRLPEALVWAYDTDPWARRMCRELSMANGVSQRVRIGGFCSPQKLLKHLTDPSFVLVDCEGFEDTLLGHIPSSARQRHDWIVELHHAPFGLDNSLVPLLAQNHEIHYVPATPKQTLHGELPRDWSQAEVGLALSELRRYPQGWIIALAHLS